MTWKMAKVRGEDWIGDSETSVPVLVPIAGKSAQDVAKANGLRVLGRTESVPFDAVVAVIDAGGFRVRAVRAD